MFPIAICDDNRLHGAQTEKAILRHAEALQAAPCYFETADALLHAIEFEGYRPCAAVLDIRMEGMDGITLARQINRLAPQCAVIFLTAFLEYATDVYESQHVYFILKGELEQRIEAALKKALTPQSNTTILSAAAQRRIPCREILYLERILRKTKIQCLSGHEFVSTAPADLLKNTSENEFIRCHQSYWVNFYHISQLNNNEFILSDGSRIPLSRTYRSAAKAQFFARIRNFSYKEDIHENRPAELY